MSNRLRVGLVGTGWVANQHARGYRMVADDLVEVTAACDPRADVLADFGDRHGIPARFATADEMIRSGEVDALALLTPPAVRDEVIDPAIEAGVHLLIEKPFATTGGLARRYVEAAEQGGITLAVGQNFRWFPEYQWLRERMGGADVGAISYLEARSFQNRPQSPDVWRARERKLEMAIFSVHLIDRLQWIAGSSPVSVSARTRRAPGSELAGEQFTSLLVDFEDGAVGQMTSSWLSKALPAQEFRVDTSTGSAQVQRRNPMDGDAAAVAMFAGVSETAAFPETADLPHGTASYGYSMREFASALRDGRTPEHSGRNNLRTMGIMEAAYLSADRGGDPVMVEEALSDGVLV